MPELTATSTLLLAFLGAASVFLVMWILVSLFLSRRRAEVERRVRPGEDSDPIILLDGPMADRGPFGSWRRLYRTAQEWLHRADLGLDLPEAAAITLFCGVVLAALVYFWRESEEEGWLAIPTFFIGAAIPLGVIAYRQRRWRLRLQDQLPDTLFLMSRSLRSGMSIDQSIQVIGDHGVAPLSREFSRMHRQLELGLSLPQVLQTTAERVRLTDFRVFSSVLSLHRTTGGNLPVVVDRLAQSTRDRNQLRGYYRTMTSLGRLGSVIAIILICVILFYMFFFLRDLAAHYFETAAGLTMFVIGMTLLLSGVVLLWYMSLEDE